MFPNHWNSAVFTSEFMVEYVLDIAMENSLCQDLSGIAIVVIQLPQPEDSETLFCKGVHLLVLHKKGKIFYLIKHLLHIPSSFVSSIFKTLMSVIQLNTQPKQMNILY